MDWLKARALDIKEAYGPLAKVVIEASVEFIVVVVLLKVSRWFVEKVAPEFSCHNLIDCVHSGAFVVVWMMLVLTFVVYSGLFVWERLRARARILPDHFTVRLTNVEGSLTKVEGQLTEVVTNVEGSLTKVEGKTDYASALVIALTSLENTATILDREGALAQLQKLRAEDLVDRRIAILSGRLLRKLGRIDQAITVLSDFIVAKTVRREMDVDYADAHYNRACYHLVKRAEVTDPDAKDALLERVYDDLAVSIRYNPQNVKDARDDSDFAEIRDEPRFKEIVA
jgi:hypothetical protein